MLTVNILAIINVVILFALLFFRKENALSNKILAISFLIPGLYFVNTIFILAGYQKLLSVSLFFVQMVAVLFPVTLYYYFNLLQGKGFRVNKTLFIGSALLLLYITTLAIRFALLSPSAQTTYIQRLSTEDYPLDMFLYTVFFYVWQLVYFSVITRDIIRYKKQLNDNLSNLEQSKFHYMVRFIVLLWCFNAILVGLYICFPLYIVDYILLPIVVNALYAFILYFSFHHNAIFTSATFNLLNKVNTEVNKEIPADDDEKKKNVLTDKHHEAYLALTELIEKDLIYTDPDLSLKTISSKTGIAEYIVSQAINHYYQKSFFNLINEKRVETSKCRLLAMKPTETIEGIAYDTGFNSRSSFYRAFKKYTGKTPQQFILSSKPQ